MDASMALVLGPDSTAVTRPRVAVVESGSPISLIVSCLALALSTAVWVTRGVGGSERGEMGRSGQGPAERLILFLSLVCGWGRQGVKAKRIKLALNAMNNTLCLLLLLCFCGDTLIRLAEDRLEFECVCSSTWSI